jgi:hypothetical protein
VRPTQPAAAAGKPFDLQTPLFLGAPQPHRDATPPKSPASKSAARPSPAASAYVLREVYDGAAVIESSAGRRKVGVGETVPGIGKIQAIEMRNRRWVVVTSSGVIAPEE